MHDDSQTFKPLPDSPQELRGTLLCYLCGDLPQADSEQFQQLLLENDEISRQTTVLEEEILEDYALGALSRRQEHALGPWVAVSEQRREHVRLTRMLHNRALRRSALGRPWVRWAATAALLTAAVTLSLLWRHTTGGLSKPVPSASLPAPSSSPASAPGDGLNALPQLQASIVLLRVERMRAGIVGAPKAEDQMSTYAVRSDVPVRLQILLPAFAGKPSVQANFSLTISPTEANRAPTIRRDGLTPQHIGGSSYLEATLPADSIPTGGYMARVSCNDGEYAAHFRVVARAATR